MALLFPMEERGSHVDVAYFTASRRHLGQLAHVDLELEREGVSQGQGKILWNN